MLVSKRNGNLVNFDKNKIIIAIQKAMLEVNINTDKAYDITKIVCDKIKDRSEISIEEIQDVIESTLMENNYPTVAKAYILYRDERKRARESHPLDESVLGLLNLTNNEVMDENSNKNATLVSTQRDLIAGEISKHIAKTKMIPKDIVNAHEKGVIHIHDLDYYAQSLTNCELVPLDDIFEKGTVINKKLIRTPKSLKTASTLATQIATKISSYTYGGQTMSLSHLAPYVRISEEKIREEVLNELSITDTDMSVINIEKIVQSRLKKEIKDSIQTFNYQLSTMNSTNGQSPFLSLALYINEKPEYKKETAMLIEEVLNQRIEGMENEFGVKSTPTFPKLLFFLDEDNMYPDSEYYYLKQLAVKCTSLRMNPDYISAKKMKELYDGFVFPCMGCRSFLTPMVDENGNGLFYSRGNVGVQSINLPFVSLIAKRENRNFYEVLNEYLNLCKRMGILRFEKLKGVKAKVAPLLWQYGVFSRLQPEEEILPVIKSKFTVSLGYAGLYETVKIMTGKSHTTKEGFEFAKELMEYLNDTCKKWREETGLLFSLYGTPAESTAGLFCNKIKKEFGEIKDITDKGFITNSYHVDVREEIDAFTKLEIEGKLQSESLGGCVSYIETYNMNKNLKALEQVVDYIYNNDTYAEINFESDVCGKCGYQGVMEYNLNEDKWVCPNCGNDDQNKLSVVRRTCGYLSENRWTKGRVLDILNRVKHL